MAMSATLKTGHHWRSMKSTTSTAEEAAAAEDAVADVAERAADHEAGCHGGQCAFDRAATRGRGRR